ncbi:adhesion G-protein coupled receptor G7 isoform X2 [Lissotriton helveticus]
MLQNRSQFTSLFKGLLCFFGAFLLTLLTWLLISNVYKASVPEPPSPTLSTSSPLPQTTEEPPLDCQNGGSYIPQPKGCLCPDRWRGPLCNESNVCNPKQFPDENISFPSIIAGTNGNSFDVCPSDTYHAGLPRATVFCAEDLTLSKPVIMDCGKTLEVLLEEIQSAPSEEKALEVACSTQLITSQPENLEKRNIESAAGIVVQILSNSQVTNNTEVTNAAITTVSQLLEAPANQFERGLTESLTKQMEAFSLEGTNIAQKSVAVQSAALLTEASTGVLFTALIVDEYNKTTFVNSSINVDNNVTKFTVNPNAEIQLFVNATGSTNETSLARIGFVLYQNDKFFKSERFKSKQDFSRKIISGNIPSTNSYNVELAIRRQDNSRFSLHDFACVFWNYSQGDWDTRGCEKVSVDDGFLRCICNHTTNFAVLMSFKQNYTYAKPLEIVSVAGCSLSIVGLTITIIFQVINKPKKTRRSSAVWTLVSLCSAMLAFNVIFIFGVENKEGANKKSHSEENISQENTVLDSDIVKNRNDLCTAVTALLHYFLLATFAWTAVIAGEMYMKFIRIFTVSPRHFKLIQSAIGWGVPAVIVAVTFGATYPFDDLRYRQEEFTRNVSYIKKAVSTLSVAMTLGITWVIGYLLLIETDPTTATIFSFVFCLLNATQGLQIFLLYTLKSQVFLKQVTMLFNKLSAPGIYIHSDKYHMIKHRVKATNERYKLHETTTDSTEFTLSTTAR